MAAATTSAHIFSHQDNNNSNNNSNNEVVNRQDIQAAIAKAVELRALHAALMQGTSPANLRYLSVSRSVSQFSSQDYPVFTPSYEVEPLFGPHQILSKSRTLFQARDDCGQEGGGNSCEDYKKESLSTRNGLSSGLSNFESRIGPAEDQKSVTSSSANNIAVLQSSPRTEFYESSRRNSLADFNSPSSCNRCKPANIISESKDLTRNNRNPNLVVPLTDSRSPVQPQQPKNRGKISWFFPKFKKKHKNENSPNRTEPKEAPQVLKDLGMSSVEALRRELSEAIESRDAALMEVSEMKSSLGELRQKLEWLEGYCVELKKALRQATQAKNSQGSEKVGNFLKLGKSIDGNGGISMPVSDEVMEEGFLQIVFEARLSVKQFCKTLVGQIEETDASLMDNLNLLLQPYKLSLNSKYSKAVLYHLQAIVNQALFQDFENCVFQRNGSPMHLDPQQDRQVQFSSFVGLRNLSWNEALRKETKFYNEEFSKFCDRKMSCIVTTLNWTRPWPEQLHQAFFVAAKCIWLLHLLTFSFNPPFSILRVEENRSFDPQYMEDVFMGRQRAQGPSWVKIMVMPGFYVHGRVLRCKVLCRQKAAT